MSQFIDENIRRSKANGWKERKIEDKIKGQMVGKKIPSNLFAYLVIDGVIFKAERREARVTLLEKKCKDKDLSR